LGAVVLDDTYNMNPASARAALRALAGTAKTGAKRWVVFGGMRELGSGAAELHRELGREVAAGGFERLVCVGPGAAEIAAGALAGGMAAAAVALPADREAAQQLLRAELREGDVVLCKASRGERLDLLVDALTAPVAEGDG
jgi:UDP-N-acetylmuramoyl-tripeptide--D-alanyl-D-alanine ligase